MDKALVIMAAGMGSRFGGLKQIESVGPDGSLIIDYSIHDAKLAGFTKVVFIIKKEIEELFREKIGNRIEKLIKTEYVFQELDDIPDGFTVPEGRVKPWGTGQAILACKAVINEPFLVINADDFYGKGSFVQMSRWIDENYDDAMKNYSFSMCGYILRNTLTENGHVARGVCSVNGEGYLDDVNERTKIMRIDGQTKYTENETDWIAVEENSCVSMNMWCLSPLVFPYLEKSFTEFLTDAAGDTTGKAEFLLPQFIKELVLNKVCTVKVIMTDEVWYGVTYRDDKERVVRAIEAMVNKGVYPEKL